MDIQITISTDAHKQALGNILSMDKQADASPVAPEKKTKDEANFREALISKFINIDENCTTCEYFIKPQGDMMATCQLVKGTVEKRFVSDLYKRGENDTSR